MLKLEFYGLVLGYTKSESTHCLALSLLLYKHREHIINSFIIVERIGDGSVYESRLSNEIIEALNRKAKGLK